MAGDAENAAPVLDAASEQERLEAIRKAAFLTAAMGLAHALLFLLAIWLSRGMPGPDSTDQQIMSYYTSSAHRRPIVVGLYIMPFAGIAFIWFIVALRMWTSGEIRRQNVLLSNIQFVSGILYVGLMFASSAASSVLAASLEFADSTIDPVVAREFPQYGRALLFVFGMRMGAMFVFTTTNIIKSVGLMPRWFAWVGFVTGAFLLLSASFESWFVVVFPVWLIVLCAIMINRARRIPKSVPEVPASPAEAPDYAL